jgi:hypothetical protein
MGTAVPNSSQLSQFLREYCVSGVSVGVATVCTNPIGSPYVFMQQNMLYAHLCACCSMFVIYMMYEDRELQHT